ncbi:hypothetical protein NLJ89_g1924 [Agrocybe chaxingu]|uniref:Uncharacterized protein n=1 Tax=Agrocybe chaxingu TaxID=84603 RepID=A0A9W8MZ45_9AGAR|nr:hypothetical protein NLJ89_g1924 [Agrocybe chaxingu]
MALRRLNYDDRAYSGLWKLRDERGPIDVKLIIEEVKLQAGAYDEKLGKRHVSYINGALNELRKHHYIRKRTDPNTKTVYVTILDSLRPILRSVDRVLQDPAHDSLSPFDKHRAICKHLRLSLRKVYQKRTTKAQYAELALDMRDENDDLKEAIREHEKKCSLGFGPVSGEMEVEDEGEDAMDVADEFVEGSSAGPQVRPRTPTRQSPPPLSNNTTVAYPTPRSPSRVSSSGNSVYQTPTRGSTPEPSRFPGAFESNDIQEEDHIAPIVSRPLPQTPIRRSESLNNPAPYPSPQSLPRRPTPPRTSPPPIPESPTRRSSPEAEAGPSVTQDDDDDDDFTMDIDDNTPVNHDSRQWGYWKAMWSNSDKKLQKEVTAHQATKTLFCKAKDQVVYYKELAESYADTAMERARTLKAKIRAGPPGLDLDLDM